MLLGSRSIVVGCAVLVVTGCAGTQFGRERAAEKLNPKGNLGPPTPEQLTKVQQLKTADWQKAAKDHLVATCDARAASAKITQADLDLVQKHIGAWTAWVKDKPVPAPKPKTGTTVGDLAGHVDYDTDYVTAITLACPQGAPVTLDVNGTKHTLDVVWALSSKTKTSASLQGISFADKKMVFVSVEVPSPEDLKRDPKATSHQSFVVSNVSQFLVDGADEPLVLPTSSGNFETLVFAKGATEGFYFFAPVKEDLGLDHFIGVGKFKVFD
jgi:hypothetical protein